MTEERLNEILSDFWRQRIALIGDLFLDKYLYLQQGVSEVSLETKLEAYQIESVKNSPGALGTVINNLKSLGVEHLTPISVIGSDGHGFDLLNSLEELTVNTEFIAQEPTRLTPTYTKPMRLTEQGWVELNRLDLRTREPLAEGLLMQLQMQVRAVLQKCDGLIVVDQIVEEDQGVIHHSIRNTICQIAESQKRKTVFIDSRAHLGKFNAGILKSNVQELSLVAGKTLENDLEIQNAAKQLSDQTGATVFTSLGERGICVAENKTQATICAAAPVTGPIDMVGAGDTATAAITAALIAGATPVEAAEIGNLAASISIQQLGTTGVATPGQIVERFRELN